MVVKAKKGRARYIVFDVSPDLKKDALIKGLKPIDPGSPPYIIHCASGKAIVRCSPKNREDVVRTMSVIDPSSVSLLTSGTLRKIREAYPELRPKKR